MVTNRLSPTITVAVARVKCVCLTLPKLKAQTRDIIFRYAMLIVIRA